MEEASPATDHDFSPSSLMSRPKSEKLASPQNEYYYVSIIDAFISLGMVRYIHWCVRELVSTLYSEQNDRHSSQNFCIQNVKVI